MARFLTRRRFLGQSASIAAGLAVPQSVWNSSARRAHAAEEPFDLLITGGTLVDGTGAKRFAGDLGIRKGRIAKIGPLAGAPAARVIKADGRIVAPGFIDMHSHSDRTLLADGDAQSAVRQGATTHVVGNCGGSPAPLAEPAEVSGHKLHSYGDFLAALTRSKTSINVCGLIGHNTVRSAVMGLQNRQPTAAELERMQALIEEAMQSGAVGMSTGLVSPPGTFSKTEEIIALAKVVAKHGGIYASHMRGEASTLVDSVREALRIGREAEVRVQISHHKAAGKENWGKTRDTLPLIEAANKEGPAVRVDVYPYRAGSASLDQLVPPWAHEGGRGEMLERLRDPETRKKIARDMTVGAEDWPNFFVIDWDDIQITSAATKANQQWIGKKVGDVARARNCAGVDACIDLLIEEKSAIGMINFIMDEDEVRRVLKHPLSLIGSDGTAVSAAGAQGRPHPRFYGCFPRVLGRYCREEKLFSLETAIHKMTGMTAAQLHLPDRGTLREGSAADVVVFDFETILDRATFDDPHQYPVGIDAVIVNGQLVVHENQHLGNRPGQVLKHAAT